MTDKCNKCSDLLIVGENWTEASKTKNHYTCSTCRCLYQRKWHSENKGRQNALSRGRYSKNRVSVLEKQREKYIKNTFGISVNKYDSYFENAVCSICGIDSSLVLDHCHETGKIRGVLCRACNMALGLLGDNINGLRKAVEYLNENN